MAEKLCIFCKHFDWDDIGSRHWDTYSEDYGGAICKIGHYKELRPFNADELREILLRAAACPDYQRPEEK